MSRGRGETMVGGRNDAPPLLRGEERSEVATDTSPWLAHPLKRATDVVVGAAALALSLPAMLLIALAIRLDSGGPVLFRQERVGEGGRSFRMIKFRTMRVGADERLERVLADDRDAASTWAAYQKLATDPRVTRVGRVLRRFSLDELPQLWNTVRGDMTLVGPRPILPEQREAYGEAFAGYVRGRPGLTGVWQVSGRNRLSFEERVECDDRYRRSCTLHLDVRILLRTVVAVVTRDGAW